MSIFNCPKCDADISDTYEEDDDSIGIVGSWYCDVCDEGFPAHEYGSNGGDFYE